MTGAQASVVVFLRRISGVPTRPEEWAEVLTNAVALGWAWAFANADVYIPPGTPAQHIVEVFGEWIPAIAMLATAILPIVSMGIGSTRFRFISTIVCTCPWAVLLLVSWEAGFWISPSICSAMVCVVALVRSQAYIMSRPNWWLA